MWIQGMNTDGDPQLSLIVNWREDLGGEYMDEVSKLMVSKLRCPGWVIS
jgi:hypothetical protein